MSLKDVIAADVADVFHRTDEFGEVVEYLPDAALVAADRESVPAVIDLEDETQQDERGRGYVRRAKLLLQFVPDADYPTRRPIATTTEDRTVELRRHSAWIFGGERWETDRIDTPQDGAIVCHVVTRRGESTTTEARTRTGR